MRQGVLVLVFAAGCVSSDAVECADGRVCPNGMECAAVTDPAESLCVTKEELDACAGAERYSHCMTSHVTAGRCYDGVCLPFGCGNGRVDRADPAVVEAGETCDDGNQAPGDGCSADCISDETCGNGIVDTTKSEQCDDGNRRDHDACDSLCRPEVVNWEQHDSAEPPHLQQRLWTAMAYDIARNQIVLFGGFYSDAEQIIYGDTWVWDARGWMEIKGTTAPPARYQHAMAYDAARHRVVMFGGLDTQGFPTSDTWEWDGVRWTQALSAVSPAPRSGHMMAWDGKRKRVVLFGGGRELVANLSVPQVEFEDTWLWDGSEWAKQPSTVWPTCPAPEVSNGGRAFAAMAFDPARGATVLFGGVCHKFNGLSLSTFYPSNEVYELDASGWHEVATASTKPGSSAGIAAAYVPTSHRVLVYTNGEHWEWSGTTWTHLTPSTLPGSRSNYAMTTDPERKVVVFTGGAAFSTDDPTFEYNGTDWRIVAPTAPGGEFEHVGAYDSDRQVAVLLDGNNNTYERIDTSWVKRAPLASTTFRPDRALAYDANAKRMVLFEADGTDVFTRLWDGSTWQTVTPSMSPDRQSLFAMATDRERGRVVLFGGADLNFSPLDDTWLWNGTTWTLAAPAHKPPGRYGHVLAYDERRRVLVLHGGLDVDYNALPDTWEWDGTDWTEIPVTTAVPSGRTSAAFAWEPARERMLLVGGYSLTGTIALGDTWEWTGSGWEIVPVTTSPGGRGASVLLPERDGSGMYLAGGYHRPEIFLQPHIPLVDAWQLRWRGVGVPDSCTDRLDLDEDMLVGCDDPDCAAVCAPSCGDSTCTGVQETCRSCPMDCGVCPAVCGDSYCDPGEAASSCPNDCP